MVPRQKHSTDLNRNRVRANNPIVEYLRYESLNSEQKIHLFFNKTIKYQYLSI